MVRGCEKGEGREERDQEWRGEEREERRGEGGEGDVEEVILPIFCSYPRT